MLGALVKLNLAALALQPGCEQGPMSSFEPRPLSVVLEAKKQKEPLGPAARDDVGLVVRDAGKLGQVAMGGGRAGTDTDYHTASAACHGGGACCTGQCQASVLWDNEPGM